MRIQNAEPSGSFGTCLDFLLLSDLLGFLKQMGLEAARRTKIKKGIFYFRKHAALPTASGLNEHWHAWAIFEALKVSNLVSRVCLHGCPEKPGAMEPSPWHAGLPWASPLLWTAFAGAARLLCSAGSCRAEPLPKEYISCLMHWEEMSRQLHKASLLSCEAHKSVKHYNYYIMLNALFENLMLEKDKQNITTPTSWLLSLWLVMNTKVSKKYCTTPLTPPPPKQAFSARRHWPAGRVREAQRCRRCFRKAAACREATRHTRLTGLMARYSRWHRKSPARPACHFLWRNIMMIWWFLVGFLKNMS